MTTSLVLAALVAALTGLSGAALTYIVARRTTSGTVATSDASTLWEVSNAIRADLRQEVVGLRKEIEAQRKEIDEQRAKVLQLEAEVRRLTGLLESK